MTGQRSCHCRRPIPEQWDAPQSGYRCVKCGHDVHIKPAKPLVRPRRERTASS